MRNPRRLVPLIVGLAIFVGFTLAPPLPDTVDPFHPRAMRASSGMVLRLAISCDVTAAALARGCQ